jgi:hypothetical protein
MSEIMDLYKLEVVKAWDKASWNFKDACDEANSKTSHARTWLIEDTSRWWEIITWVNWVQKVVESIDWVWTKVQIYTSVFNNIVSEFEEGKISDQELFDTSVELWERMLYDLIAMNVDDLRNWEMAVAVTNIIDINHLNWIRWKVFSDSMAIAMWNVISKLDIAITAWETAILWEPKKVSELESEAEKLALNLLQVIEKSITFISIEVKTEIEDILNKSKLARQKIKNELEFNIWWTWLWVVGKYDKLIPLEPGQAIISLHEKPTKNWIIWPRSNWITSIRKNLISLAWEWWENLTFEEFLEKIWTDKSSKIPQRLKNELLGLKMWDIATGKTTVFNPFVSRELLWWLNQSPFAEISSIIHVTWNPLRKIKDWLRGEENLSIDIDLWDVKIPQIIELLQILGEISDEEALSSWNMWVPYAIVCRIDEVEYIIDLAEGKWFNASYIGHVVSWTESNVRNVWIWKDTITL